MAETACRGVPEDEDVESSYSGSSSDSSLSSCTISAPQFSPLTSDISSSEGESENCLLPSSEGSETAEGNVQVVDLPG